MRSAIILLSLMYVNEAISGFEEKVSILIQKRAHRSCELDGGDIGSTLHNLSVGVLVLLFCIGTLFALLFLGLLKGIIGYTIWPALGVFGMNVLVDLPRPMQKYHEPELKDIQPVQYDVAGWPIHPQTGRRTVRALSRKTEFCMNVIFFLTYPMVMLVKLISIVCYKSYDEEGTDNKIYDNVNTVVFSECPTYQVTDCKEKSKMCRGACVKDIYEDNDSEEDVDTQYVLDQMNRSQNRLSTNGSKQRLNARGSR